MTYVEPKYFLTRLRNGKKCGDASRQRRVRTLILHVCLFVCILKPPRRKSGTFPLILLVEGMYAFNYLVSFCNLLHSDQDSALKCLMR